MKKRAEQAAEDLVSFASFSDPAGAQMACNFLQTKGILCSVQDGFLDPGPPSNMVAFGPVSLVGRPEDMERALKFLKPSNRAGREYL